MYSRLFSDGRIDPKVFDIIFRHHVRIYGLTLEEYAVKLDQRIDYIERLARGRAVPNNAVLHDMGIKYTSLSEGYFEDI